MLITRSGRLQESPMDLHCHRLKQLTCHSMKYHTNNHTMKLKRSINFLPKDERTRMRIPLQSFVDMDFESFFHSTSNPWAGQNQ